MDHRPLTWLFNVTDPDSRLIRWRLKLEEYDYEIVQGKGNTNADALSNPISNHQHVHISQKDEKEEREYPEEEKRQILYEYHDAVNGHQGFARTLSRMRLQHNWHSIQRRGRIH